VAIFVSDTGVLAKLYTEAIENANEDRSMVPEWAETPSALRALARSTRPEGTRHKS
jgi:ABC-type phosphate/phosphonate transport system permease subunit